MENQPTMNLGVIGKTSLSAADRALVLHTMGHILGLGHECDGRNIQLPSGASNEEVARYAGKVFSNYPRMDDNSIMRCARILTRLFSLS
jgi:hypothetical protein